MFPNTPSPLKSPSQLNFFVQMNTHIGVQIIFLPTNKVTMNIKNGFIFFLANKKKVNLSPS